MSFTSFARLPAELRQQIYRDAVAIELKPGLCTFDKRCWQFEPSEFDEGRFVINFQNSLVDRVRCKPPSLFYVDREARATTFKWIQEHDDIQGHVETSEFGRRAIFTRSYDYKYDAIYLPENKVQEYSRKPVEDLIELALATHRVVDGCGMPWGTSEMEQTKHLALPLFPYDSQLPGEVVEHLDYYNRGLKEIWIVVDSPPRCSRSSHIESVSSVDYLSLGKSMQMRTDWCMAEVPQEHLDVETRRRVDHMISQLQFYFTANDEQMDRGEYSWRMTYRTVTALHV